MPNILIVGADRAAFSPDLIGDILFSEGLVGNRLSLVDIDEQQLPLGIGPRMAKQTHE